MIKESISLLVIGLFTRCLCEFIEIPPHGDRLESRSLDLRWNHNFRYISGCFWTFMGQELAEETFISYSHTLGLETLNGWQLSNYTNPCSGNIFKEKSTPSDAGTYEFGIIQGNSIHRSESSRVGIIQRDKRVVQVKFSYYFTLIFPGQNNDTMLLFEKDSACEINLGEGYPPSTCTTVHTYRRKKGTETINMTHDTSHICNKSFLLDFDDDAVTHMWLTVPIDAVDYKNFTFTIKAQVARKYQCKKQLTTKPSTECHNIGLLHWKLVMGILFLAMAMNVLSFICIFKKQIRKCFEQCTCTRTSTSTSIFERKPSLCRDSMQEGSNAEESDDEGHQSLDIFKSSTSTQKAHCPAIRITTEASDDEGVREPL